MAAVIECQQLRKTFPSRTGPVEAVRGVDLEVQAGECFGLLGPNGAGKTTTIEILEGLQTATSGSVRLFGQEWTAHTGDDLRQRIGITLQETRLAEKLTVRETVQLFRSFYAQGPTVDEVLSLVQLHEKQHGYVGKLSGGQKQRLALACALAGAPELLFLDEPTTGLDPQSRRQLWDVIRTFKHQGRTVLLTTHYMDEAERLCDRIAIVDQGKVIALASPAELIAQLGGNHRVEFKLTAGTLPEADLHALPGVVRVLNEVEVLALVVEAPHITLPPLLELAQRHGHTFAQLTTRQSSLEDVFVALTGRHLRDEG
jgi:ABC-2 type transport system ATP-binding protein